MKTTKKNAPNPTTTTRASSSLDSKAQAQSVVIKPPPADAKIPTPPEGATNSNGNDYRASLPKNLELAAMPDVLEELGRFIDYVEVFGKTAPPLAYVLQTATAASEWSEMRVTTAAWDAYCRTQEAAAWFDLRTIMAGLSPAMKLAVRIDATIAREYPALVRLFSAKQVIAQRGVTTRKLNAKAKADGLPPVRGRAAKRAKKGGATTTPVATPPAPVAQPSPAPAAPPPAAPPAAAAPIAPNGASSTVHTTS
ncbi:MAG TPA: hypothetical protein VGI39_27535 [Polyangiaceae bacterium]